MRSKRSFQLPLRMMIILPFTVLMVGFVAWMGVSVSTKGMRAIEATGGRLRSEIFQRLEERIRNYFDVPHMITRINADLTSQGLLDLENQDELETYLRYQIASYPTVSSTYFANDAGGLIDAGREGENGAFYIIATDEFKSGTFRKYSIDADGNRTELLLTADGFDARTRRWYTSAVDAGEPVFSDPYTLFSGQDMAIASSRPVYDEQETPAGVFSVDIFLSQIGTFLADLQLGEQGLAFIMERSGELIATSSPEVPVLAWMTGDNAARIAGRDSENPVVRLASRVVEETYPNLSAASGPEKTRLQVGDDEYFMSVWPLVDSRGLDWVVVFTNLREEFLAPIMIFTRQTEILIVSAIILVIMAGIHIAYVINKPISRLDTLVTQLATGEWDPPYYVRSRITEIKNLSQNFILMAGQLHRTLDRLTGEITIREKKETALKENEERLELVLEGGELGSWDYYVQTGRVVYNERWARMLGYSPKEIEAKYETWENLLHPDERSRVLAELDRHLKGETSLYRVEHRLRSKTGEWRWILSTGKVLVRDKDGNPVRASGTHEDITERKHAEAVLEETNRKLQTALVELEHTQETLVQQERLAAIGQLAAGIAHDFNNILSSIMGFAELIQTAPEFPKTLYEDASNIVSQSERAAHLVRQILDFSRKTIRIVKRIELTSFVRNETQFLRRTIPESVQIELDFPDEEFPILVDSTQLHQLVTNLVLNAKDAMPNGGRLEISIRNITAVERIPCMLCKKEIRGPWIEFAVADTGTGISPEVLPRVFEPFFTTKEVGKGSGLGLPQVIGIIQQHDGHLRIDTVPGKGTTVRCFFSQDTSSGESQPGRSDSMVHQGNGEAVLLVEDEPMVLRATTAMLRQLGYRVFTAHDGNEGLAVYIENESDIEVVISDAIMPDMDGITLFNELRVRNPRLRMILMSGYPKGDNDLTLFEEGLVDWLAKPITLSSLSSAVREALDPSRTAI